MYAIRVVLFLLNKTWSSHMKAFDSNFKLPCHPLKGLPIIVTTLFGIVMLVRDLHAPKPQFPIVVTLFGIFMLVRESQDTKAKSPIVVTLFGMFMLVRDLQSQNVLLVDYKYYTLKTVEKWQNRFCVDTKNVRFNVFNFWLHQNHIDMDWMGEFEPTP